MKRFIVVLILLISNLSYATPRHNDIIIDGIIYDNNGDPGTNGQHLKSTGTGIEWDTGPYGSESGAPDNSIYVDSSGNVGIGTTTPSHTLDINGTLELTGSASGIHYKDSQWQGKNITWVGTSICEEGSPAAYPDLVGTLLGATVTELCESGSYMTWDINAADETCTSGFLRARGFSVTIAEMQSKITNAVNGSAYCTINSTSCTPTCANNQGDVGDTFLLGQSYENKIIGTNPGLVVFDIGHNDRADTDYGDINETWIAATAITKANPAVVTDVAHGLSTGDKLSLKITTGMTDANAWAGTITKLTDDTFSLDGLDSTAFTAFTSGTYATYDVTKYYEAANYTIRALYYDNIDVQIAFISPPTYYTAGTEDYTNISRIRNANRMLARKYGASHFDLTNALAINNINLTTWFTDSTHPDTVAARSLIAEQIAGWLAGGMQSSAPPFGAELNLNDDDVVLKNGNLDFDSNKAINMAIDSGTSFDSTPAVGQVKIRTDVNTKYEFDGTDWVALSNTGDADFYVSSSSGADTPGKGFGSGGDAVATIPYALSKLIPPGWVGDIDLHIEGTHSLLTVNIPPGGTGYLTIIGDVTALESGTLQKTHVKATDNDGEYVWVQLENNEFSGDNYWPNETGTANFIRITAGTAVGAIHFIKYHDNDDLAYTLGEFSESWFGGAPVGTSGDSYEIYTPTASINGVTITSDRVKLKQLKITGDVIIDGKNCEVRGCIVDVDTTLERIVNTLGGGNLTRYISNYMVSYGSSVVGWFSQNYSGASISSSYINSDQALAAWGAMQAIDGASLLVLQGTELTTSAHGSAPCGSLSQSNSRITWQAGSGIGLDRIWGFEDAMCAESGSRQIDSTTQLFYSGVFTSGTSTATSSASQLVDTGNHFQDSTGTATSGTTTTLTDSGAPWSANAYNLYNSSSGAKNKRYLEITAGTNSGETLPIFSNTTDTITVIGTFTSAIDATSVYRIKGLDTANHYYAVLDGLTDKYVASVSSVASDTALNLTAISARLTGTHTNATPSSTTLFDTNNSPGWSTNELDDYRVFNTTDGTDLDIDSNAGITITHAAGTITWNTNDAYVALPDTVAYKIVLINNNLVSGSEPQRL
jgi:hypothetical protein